jgi:hypothetical protein
MLGFELNLWDHLTFLTLVLAVVAGVAFWVWLAGLPGRIAIARKHPEAQAQLIKARGLQRVNRIRLYLALGAGFEAAPAASTM